MPLRSGDCGRSHRGAFLSRIAAAKRGARIRPWKLLRATCRRVSNNSLEQHRYQNSFFSKCLYGVCLGITCQMLMTCNPGWIAAWVFCTCGIFSMLACMAVVWMHLALVFAAAWIRTNSSANAASETSFVVSKLGDDVSALAVSCLTAPAFRKNLSMTFLLVFPVLLFAFLLYALPQMNWNKYLIATLAYTLSKILARSCGIHLQRCKLATVAAVSFTIVLVENPCSLFCFEVWFAMPLCVCPESWLWWPDSDCEEICEEIPDSISHSVF